MSGAPATADLLVGARPDDVFDRIARLACTALRVPAAVVSFGGAQLQVHPGAVGLPEPWQTTRFTPAGGTVTGTGAGAARGPLHDVAVADTASDPTWGHRAGAHVLGARAVASRSLRAVDGAVVGALVVLDQQVHPWSAQELSVLADLAATCEGELRLRESLEASRSQRADAEHARDAATAAELAAVAGRAEAESSRAHTALLLDLSEAMAATRDVADVAAAVDRAARRWLGADHVDVALLDERERLLRPLPAGAGAGPSAPPVPLDGAAGAAVAVRRRRTDRDAGGSVEAVVDLRRDPSALSTSVVHLPLVAAGVAVGALTIGWSSPRTVELREQQVVAALADYTAQALQRCLLLQAEHDVAVTLQRALLPQLPPPERSTGVRVAGCYAPAAAGHEVGGDWYDAIPGPGGSLTAVVGDATGHDVAAAAVMGQLRSALGVLVVALRQRPAATLASLDRAVADLGGRASATAVLAHCQPDGDVLRVRWSNAGHPPPLRLTADGRVEVLETEPELLLGQFADAVRSDHEVALVVGDTLLMHTDGLVERRGSDLDTGTRALVAALAARAGQELDDLLTGLLDDLVERRDAEDDVAVLALRWQG